MMAMDFDGVLISSDVSDYIEFWFKDQAMKQAMTQEGTGMLL